MTALRDALLGLDPSNDTHWTKAGLPALNHLEGVTGGSVTRAAVDALVPNGATREDWAGAVEAMVAAGAPDAEAAPEANGTDSVADDDRAAQSEPAHYEPYVAGIVQVTTAEPHDGAEVSAAIVVKVNDDGSVNLRLFSANGGADGFLAGVNFRDLTGDEDAPRPFWEWPY